MAVAIYMVGALLITIYTLGEFHLLYILFKRKGDPKFEPETQVWDWDTLPKVTVQLPMYNEQYVAKDVISACAQLDYPKDKLEIQVVDDSNDETKAIVDEQVAFWSSKGINIKVFRRDHRAGYKAGALRDATPYAEGDFIAIFDADFKPEPDFLQKSIPYFKHENVGVVQGKWGHINRDYSVLTKAQSAFLDMFFLIEQKARSLGGYFLRFNGSAGVWRKVCIEDAGGWSADTLSEDLDLCFRAQLKGWKVLYDEKIVAPAEVPVTILDFKTQQYRWTKGKAQVIRKLGPKLWKANIPLLSKVHAFFDLYNIFVLPGFFSLAISSVFISYLITQIPKYNSILALSTVGLINIVLVPIFLWIVIGDYKKGIVPKAIEFVKTLPPFIGTLLGITFFQLLSFLDGIRGGDAVFHRTAKYNISTKGDSWHNKLYSPREIPIVTYAEGSLVVLFLFALWVDFSFKSYGFVPSHIVFTAGFGFVFLNSIVRS
ncbi:MAG: glycosyltransferase family 2 protein [Bacteroidota bacterium]